MFEEFYRLLKQIMPYDDEENKEIFQIISQEDEPLVDLYIVLVDPNKQRLVLTRHAEHLRPYAIALTHPITKKSLLETAQRELERELEILFQPPLFLSAEPVEEGKNKYYLWTVFYLEYEVSQPLYLNHQLAEWYEFEAIPYAEAEKNMQRFVQKLKNVININK